MLFLSVGTTPVSSQVIESSVSYAIGKTSTMKLKFAYDGQYFYAFIGHIYGTKNLAKTGDKYTFVTKNGNKVSYSTTEDEINKMGEEKMCRFLADASDLKSIASGINQVYIESGNKTADFEEEPQNKKTIAEDARLILEEGITRERIKEKGIYPSWRD